MQTNASPNASADSAAPAASANATGTPGATDTIANAAPPVGGQIVRPAARAAGAPAAPEQVRRAPKVSLHDHLDGGLRPGTVAELAAEIGYADRLPTTDPEELGRWFRDAADSGSLERYLEGFAHTCAVMQTREGLIRVAAEAVEDLAADGVVYGELRYAPEQHLERGLSLTEVIEAVNEGCRLGERRAAEAGRRIRVGVLASAMRQAKRSREIAELADAYRERGVVGFDIAGPENGFPPALHQEAFDFLRFNGDHITIHAGEAYGLPSIREALHRCHAERIGHGAAIVEDITPIGEGGAEGYRLGRVASWVRDSRTCLELCPTSNLQTGVCSSYAEHPLGLLASLGFRVTVNTDNRLMSGTSLSEEFIHMVAAFGWSLADIERMTVDAAESAFLPLDERRELIEEVIRPGFAALAD
ncbi:adenosine deaminase [Allostreptomyces psammosilenae]|uniref:adenosine deaminase n=1 Tax=Allostreptomyces psammosilenae TaxID=1892865 RepID=A0A853A0W1_9ACTN|nr:adenosine deaminase [Allostreptomyces psammosilenae]NYI08009.1 adenosine deaminase [Allostreptomyces psammosilenae]